MGLWQWDWSDILVLHFFYYLIHMTHQQERSKEPYQQERELFINDPALSSAKSGKFRHIPLGRRCFPCQWDSAPDSVPVMLKNEIPSGISRHFVLLITLALGWTYSCTQMSKRNSSHDVGGGEKEEVDEAGYVDVQVLLEMSGVFSRPVPDIFLNIMSRVPLKSLFQCRLVGKSWYKLIKSPSFTKIQYEWAIKNNSPWVFFWTPRKHLYLVDDQVFDNLETSATAHDLKLSKLPRYFQTAGYVNGLICLASDPACYCPSSIYICNPITGEHITIPKSPKYETDAIAAFGFDPTTNEYKVIRFVHSVDKDGEYLSSEGEVYTLGSGEWRKIEDVPHIMDVQRCGILLNGNIHWISYVSRIINVFNVGSEKFDLIQLPPHMVQRGHTSERLVVVEGYLCLLHKEHDKPYEIWAMKDYGVQSSWFKKYSFNSKVRDWFWYGSHDLIKLRNGEFLLQCEESKNEFMGYLDLEKDTLRPIRIMRSNEHHGYDYYFRSVVQVGSLFSPKDLDKSRRGKEGVFTAEETRQSDRLES